MEKLKGIKSILDEARSQAARFHHDYVGTEHVLLAIAALEMSLLDCVGTSAEAVRAQVEKLLQSGPSMSTAGAKPFTPRVRHALELAQDEADDSEGDPGPAHLLAGLIREKEGLAATVLRELGVKIQRVREVIANGGNAADAERRRQPCEHVQKFLDDLRGLYAKNRNFVTLDEPINAHCHSCSGIHKIPENLLRRPSDYGKHPDAIRHVADRSRCVSDVMCPDSHYERKGDVEKNPTGLSIKRYVTGTINVRDEETGKHVALRLEHPISVWTLIAEDGVGVWEETYASKAEKDAFVRGYLAASAIHGDPNPRIKEDR